MSLSIKSPPIEHPDDWNMNEGPFAKRCSQLGYRLLTVADSTCARTQSPSLLERELLDRISEDIRILATLS